MEMFKDTSSVQLFIAFFVPSFIIISVWEFLVLSERSDCESDSSGSGLQLNILRSRALAHTYS